jgi:hypothetical protein
MVDMLLSKLDKLSTLTLLVSFPLTLLVSFPLSELNWLSSDMIDDVYSTELWFGVLHTYELCFGEAYFERWY